MKSVGTAILKNNLSTYLRKVRRGGRFLVTDRGKPVAKLVPLNTSESGESLEEKMAAMAAEGILTLSTSRKRFVRHKKINLGSDLAARYLQEERDSW